MSESNGGGGALRGMALKLIGGVAALSLTSSLAVGAFQAVAESKRKKSAMPCHKCKGIGFYVCKLCKGNSTIQWSPMFDPLIINPCLCPTCEGNKVQRCLNCVGKGC
ncbi:uncharacterized protein LOC124932646 isoform X2 [Impatiens glandulifera]|uniref:uncharacterized protein LOC124932646 isoform X2 n=1 Tax=Impatiens glandulifera TaxID=253017 RepID=UPI001FB139F8|nr:uncharacterized protein LOC124932646 isoform X2 [Impatiens glandulifera]